MTTYTLKAWVPMTLYDHIWEADYHDLVAASVEECIPHLMTLCSVDRAVKGGMILWHHQARGMIR
jgi:hypothetical protein